MSVTSDGAAARAIYEKYSSFFDRYHGGMPLGLMATYALRETGGKMEWGDKRIGEYGIFQITTAAEQSYGLPADFRMTVEGNFFIAGAEQNGEAVRISLKYPQLMLSGMDLWLMAHLSWGIGRGGTDKVIAAAKPSPGNVYDQLVRWATDSGGIAAGSQSAATVAHRVIAIRERWSIAEATGLSMSSDGPFIPSPPLTVSSFIVPKDIRGHIGIGSSGNLSQSLVLLALTAGAYFYLKG